MKPKDTYMAVFKTLNIQKLECQKFMSLDNLQRTEVGHSLLLFQFSTPFIFYQVRPRPFLIWYQEFDAYRPHTSNR